jgi:hypothetical protein
MPNAIDALNSDDQQTRLPRADPPASSGIVRHSTCWINPPKPGPPEGGKTH